jgi:hypothetical protein
MNEPCWIEMSKWILIVCTTVLLGCGEEGEEHRMGEGVCMSHTHPDPIDEARSETTEEPERPGAEEVSDLDAQPNEERSDADNEVASDETVEDTHVLPVRVLLLQSDAQAVHSSLSDSDVEALFETVNEIWAQAEIQFQIESMLRVEANNESDFVEALEEGSRAQPGTLQNLYPADALLGEGFNVVYVEDFGAMPPGVYHCGQGVVMMARYFGAASSRSVPPNVLAHELGHALGLDHLCGEGENLMCADGRQPTALNDAQIESASAQAQSGRAFLCQR